MSYFRTPTDLMRANRPSIWRSRTSGGSLRSNVNSQGSTPLGTTMRAAPAAVSAFAANIIPCNRTQGAAPSALQVASSCAHSSTMVATPSQYYCILHKDNASPPHAASLFFLSLCQQGLHHSRQVCAHLGEVLARCFTWPVGHHRAALTVDAHSPTAAVSREEHRLHNTAHTTKSVRLLQRWRASAPITSHNCTLSPKCEDPLCRSQAM